MKRLKLIVPAGTKWPGCLAHCKVVDADTGEAIEPLRDVTVHLPFVGTGPGSIWAELEVLISEIEAVPDDRCAEVFPGWRHDVPVTAGEPQNVRGPGPDLRCPAPPPADGQEPA